MAKKIRYSETFIKTAIDRVNSGVTQAQVAKELGINAQTLSKWCVKAKNSMSNEHRSEAEEIIRLKKELAKAKAENEFLKKLQRSLPRACSEVRVYKTMQCRQANRQRYTHAFKTSNRASRGQCQCFL